MKEGCIPFIKKKSKNRSILKGDFSFQTRRNNRVSEVRTWKRVVFLVKRKSNMNYSIDSCSFSLKRPA